MMIGQTEPDREYPIVPGWGQGEADIEPLPDGCHGNLTVATATCPAVFAGKQEDSFAAFAVDIDAFPPRRNSDVPRGRCRRQPSSRLPPSQRTAT